MSSTLHAADHLEAVELNAGDRKFLTVTKSDGTRAVVAESEYYDLGLDTLPSFVTLTDPDAQDKP